MSASSSSTSSGPTPAKKESMPVVIESVAERLAREAQREVDEYQRSLVEGDKPEVGDNEETPTGVTSPSKIVFKRSHDDLGDSEGYNNAKIARSDPEAGQPVFGAVNSPQNSIGPQALPKPPQSDSVPPPQPESSSVPKFGYDWSRGAHRGGQQGRGRGSSGAGTRPGDWPCSGSVFSDPTPLSFLTASTFPSLWKLQLCLAINVQPVCATKTSEHHASCLSWLGLQSRIWGKLWQWLWLDPSLP